MQGLASSYDRYRQMDVAAMTPAQQVVALYARLLLSLRQARLAIEKGDIEGREKRLDLAGAILHELAVSLDHSVGSTITANLASLYSWLISECIAIHANPDMSRLDAPIRIVAELHEAWEAIVNQAPARAESSVA